MPAQSSRLIDDALDRGGNPHHTIRVVPAVNHNLHVTADDGFDRLPTLPADYGDYEAAWIIWATTANPSQTPAGPSVAPAPEPAAPTLVPPAWQDTAWAQLTTLPVLLTTFAAYPLIGAIRRIRRRARGWSPRSARWLAAVCRTPQPMLCCCLG